MDLLASVANKRLTDKLPEALNDTYKKQGGPPFDVPGDTL
jgi:hypothetical protein